MSLKDKLNVAKEKSAVTEFDVTITETLQKTVTVKAKNCEEAEELVNTAWENSEFVLDADNFVGATFDASKQKTVPVRGGER